MNILKIKKGVYFFFNPFSVSLAKNGLCTIEGLLNNAEKFILSVPENEVNNKAMRRQWHGPDFAFKGELLELARFF